MAAPSRRSAPQPKSKRAQPNLALRRKVLMVLLFGAFGALSTGVFYRQILERDFLVSQGEARYMRDGEIPARRGMITDRNGEPLAVSTPVETVWADPRKLKTQLEVLPALAKALGMQGSALREKVLANADKGFLYLKRRVTFEEARAVRAAIERKKIGGVSFETEYRRFYPGGEVFSHVLGFTNVEDLGQEGIELAYDKRLHAEPGLRRVIRDGRQHIVEEVEQIRPPRPGQDLALSLDRRLQYLAYRELMSAVRKHRAKGGSAVILDAQTAEVLAMVNQPGYNPNTLRGGTSEQRRNRAVTDMMEPGSTMKPLVVAAALERGLITPRTWINTSGGTMKVGTNVVRDTHNYGSLDVTGVITKSSNVGAVRIAQMMDYAALWGIYNEVGFGHPTGIKFPGESGGVLRYYSGWRPFEHATMAFGYGLSVTPLQLAQAYAVLAADGVKQQVTLVKRDPATARGGSKETRILRAATAQKVRAMMETVVSAKGTAELAVIPGYRVGGKTGTAKKASGRHGYRAHKYQSVFAGFAPAGRPRLVMVVMIDEPSSGAYYGGVVAAPVFQRVMEGALRLLNVPPDDLTPSMLLAGGEELAR